MAATGDDDATLGVFTTAKLDALLRNGYRKGINNRRELADAMRDRDEGVSVHAIDGWFKRQETNYGTQRKSLLLDTITFQVPKRRWPILLNIFNLQASDLERSDEVFEQWVLACVAGTSETATSVESGGLARESERRFVSERPSIAVMPFSLVRGSEGNGQFLASGIAGDIATQLARIPEFFVIAYSTTQRMREYAQPSDSQAGRTTEEDLAVRFLLEGQVRAAAEKFRVSVQLVDAAESMTVWSAHFDAGTEEDLFAIQDRITIQICAHLEPQIRLSDINYGSRTGSVNAWRLWQAGWFKLFVDAPMPVPDDSLSLFRQAHELDPDYALARAGICVALTTGMLWGGLGPEHYSEAREHAIAASKSLPENPAVLYAMAMVSFVEPVELEVPLGYMQRAVDLEPSNAMYRAICGYLKANMGLAEEGLGECLEAMRLAPLDAREPFFCHMLAGAYINNQQFSEALEALRRGGRYAKVDFIILQSAFAHYRLDNRNEAIEDLRRIPEPRSRAFYEWSIYNKLWRKLPKEWKAEFLELFPLAGIL